MYGTLEKSQGSCLVRHNETPSLKAEAKMGKRGMRMGWLGWKLVGWMRMEVGNEILGINTLWRTKAYYQAKEGLSK